jgi:hypothetical protein
MYISPSIVLLGHQKSGIVLASVLQFSLIVKSQRWSSGVYWQKGDTSTQEWRYEDNPIKPEVERKLRIKEGMALVRIFGLEHS